MHSKSRLFFICLLSCSLSSASYAIDNKQQPVNELQVLIDVSGSMKKNDPDNLRIPAIKLLINLLPDGTKVGLWLFAENTTELVKTGVVDQQWKKKALLKVKKIHSSGLFTDIEEAIQTSAQEWFKSPAQNNRNLILLTDGVVDISKDIMQSAESRASIMSEQIPLLQQAGIKVQTIALSDEVDAELLGKLSFDTGGWSETALSADQLQKVFFKLFKQAIPQDTLPIVDNIFSVDSSVKELSIVIFKEQGAAATQLITANKVKLTSLSKKKTVFWLNEKNYDLITIKNPKVGDWKIIAAADPENQVMIVTDLKFEIDELASHVLLNESIDITAFFTDQQKLISREDFLNLIDISIQQPGGGKWKMPAVIGKQGLFSQSLTSKLKKGRHTLRILADGKTFKRELTKTIEVMESLVTLEKQINLNDRTVMIKLAPVRSIIDAKKMVVEASISQIGKRTERYEMEKKEGQWLLLVTAPEKGESKTVNFSIMANTLQGDAVSPNIRPVIIDDDLFENEKIKQQTVKPIRGNMDNAETAQLMADKNEDKLKDEFQTINWMKTPITVALVNILLIVICFFGFRFMKKQVANKQEQLLSRLD